MSEALKSCPFCGIEADVAHANDLSYFYAYCANEDCEIQPEGGMRDTEKDAVAAWNTRPVEDALVEALKAYDSERCENPTRKPLPNPQGYREHVELIGCGNCRACKARAALKLAGE